MYGGITQTFHGLPFSPLLATVCLVAFVLACSWLSGGKMFCNKQLLEVTPT